MQTIKRKPIAGAALPLLLIISLFIACSPDKSAKPSATAPDQAQTENNADGTIDSHEDGDVNDLSVVESEEKTINQANAIVCKLPDTIDAFTPVEIHLEPAPDPSWRIEYNWFVDNSHISGVSTQILPKEYVLPKAWLRCQVTIKDINSDYHLNTLRSDQVQISPLPPEMGSISLPELPLPGQLRFKLMASDPNEPENSPNQTLSYFLEEPESENIIVDKESGEISWSIDLETAKRLGPKVTLRFRVESSWGTSISSSFDIPLTTEGEPVSEKNEEIK